MRVNMAKKKLHLSFALAVFLVSVAGLVHGNSSPRSCLVHYDGTDWHLKGEGIVCCPCACPCPCRHNAQPTYGHCEAMLYLNLTGGRFGGVDMKGVRLAY